MTLSPDWPGFDAALSSLVPDDRIIRDLARRVALSTDASFYSKVPEYVVYIKDTPEMQALLRIAGEHQVAVTFRAAGTSLSGQAISDSVLVMLTRDWQHCQISESAEQITLAPGIVGAQANQWLKPFGKKLGPDPASINTCKIGGIAANNASGMCCGVANNSYHTLVHMTLILADGTVLNTASPDSIAAFRQSHSTLLDNVSALRNALLENESLCERVRYQYRLKNTMGYGLNALLDYDDPVAILSHLMIGSEGTLGFIADITYRTLALPVSRYTGLYLFNSISAACDVIPALRDASVDAVELMDTRALLSVASLLSPFYSNVIDDGAVALLVDVTGASATEATARLTQVNSVLTTATPMCAFTDNTDTIDALWKIRKGLFPAVGAVRDTGTTVIIEDVAFTLEDLAQGLSGLISLFERHGYDEGIIFGHALDGNVHFVFTQSFATEQDRSRYAAFMDDVATLVTQTFKGTLKAEHGTGRNMAPFLTAQWGDDGVGLMRALKHLLDPTGILNPGVIINPDPHAHLADLKHMPAVDPIVDKCIECGFCEPQCPSLHHTLSPRQRIALRRRQQTLDIEARHAIDSAFPYLGIESCAATGLCATTCPVGINTGAWVKAQRSEHASHNKLANTAARHLATGLNIARIGLSATKTLASLIQPHNLESLSRTLNRHTLGRIPVWYDDVPAGAATVNTYSQAFNDKVVYFPSCPSRLFGAAKDQDSLTDTVVRVMNKAGIEVIIPDGFNNVCCGQPWESKGYPDIAAQKRKQYTALINQARQARWPVITDASPCALQAKDVSDFITFELSEYLLSEVVPRLTIAPIDTPVMLHTTCSSTHLDSGKALRALAKLCCNQIIEPEGITCCGFAGDKGLQQPALNAAALAPLKAQVPAQCKRGISNSRTCEIGLSHHSGVAYQHIVYLLDDVSRPLTPTE